MSVVQCQEPQFDQEEDKTYRAAATWETSFSAAANKMRKALIQTDQVIKGQEMKLG
jgi:hypothetical protein